MAIDLGDLVVTQRQDDVLRMRHRNDAGVSTACSTLISPESRPAWCARRRLGASDLRGAPVGQAIDVGREVVEYVAGTGAQGVAGGPHFAAAGERLARRLQDSRRAVPPSRRRSASGTSAATYGSATR